MQETQVQSLAWEDPLEKKMAIDSSTLAWRILWTEEPDRLQFMVLRRVKVHRTQTASSFLPGETLEVNFLFIEVLKGGDSH